MFWHPQGNHPSLQGAFLYIYLEKQKKRCFNKYTATRLSSLCWYSTGYSTSVSTCKPHEKNKSRHLLQALGARKCELSVSSPRNQHHGTWWGIWSVVPDIQNEKRESRGSTTCVPSPYILLATQGTDRGGQINRDTMRFKLRWFNPWPFQLFSVSVWVYY